jgi:hypothetical protein
MFLHGNKTKVDITRHTCSFPLEIFLNWDTVWPEGIFFLVGRLANSASRVIHDIFLMASKICEVSNHVKLRILFRVDICADDDALDEYRSSSLDP